jgi:3-oxoacyl-[acyl-carrier protein] reductase
MLLMRMSDDDFTSVLDTNLSGAFRVVKRASKGMIKARFGRIILVSSVVGLLRRAGPGQLRRLEEPASSGFARSVTGSSALAASRRTSSHPGFIETDMTAELPEATQAEYKKQIPAGATPPRQEVAKVIAWLAGDDAAYISGAVIPVDGGLGMGH